MTTLISFTIGAIVPILVVYIFPKFTLPQRIFLIILTDIVLAMVLYLNLQ